MKRGRRQLPVAAGEEACGRLTRSRARELLEREKSGDPSPLPSKAMKIDAAATDVVGGSNTYTEEETQHRGTAAAAGGEGSSASPAAPVSTPPPRLRLPPYPDSGNTADAFDWLMERRRIQEIIAADPRFDLPTQRSPKDSQTTHDVKTPKDKAVVRRASRSVVSILSIDNDGVAFRQCSGIIMNQWEEKRAIIVTCSSIVCNRNQLIDPIPKLSVCLPNKTILDGQLLFFNCHYDIALLEIYVDFPLQLASIGCCPNYGQEVFVLAMDAESSLMARHGEILWSEECYRERNYCMFLSCEVPQGGRGGPVIDCDGNVTGMAFHLSPDPAVLSISTIVTCIEMWSKFSRIARPIHGLGLKTMEVMDVALHEEIFRDYDIDSGYIVDMVSDESAAENLGILPGDVIVSLNGKNNLTLPQLEDYLLSLGWQFLHNLSSRVDLKLEIYDLMRRSKRSIILPLQFSDASEDKE